MDKKQGETLKEGDTLSVVVSKGKGVKIPNLVGYTKEQLEAWTADGDNAVSLVKKTVYNTAPEGSVIEQSLKAGSVVEAGEVLELTILAMIFIYSLTEALTFSLIISIVTLIYGLVKKSNPLIVFGIITFVISMIVNLFRIFDNLALVFIILGFGIALISYVFYKETKKNKN